MQSAAGGISAPSPDAGEPAICILTLSSACYPCLQLVSRCLRLHIIWCLVRLACSAACQQRSLLTLPTSNIAFAHVGIHAVFRQPR